MTADPLDPANVLEIDDPQIDVEALMARIRANLAEHGEPVDLGSSDDARTRRLEALITLQERTSRLGEVATLKAGWRGQAELFLKRIVRKAMKRHILQQQEANEALIALLGILMTQVEEIDARQHEILAQLPGLARQDVPEHSG